MYSKIKETLECCGIIILAIICAIIVGVMEDEI
jgi:hypothetical protein